MRRDGDAALDRGADFAHIASDAATPAWSAGIEEQEPVFSVPASELLWLAAAIIAGGVVTGVLAGLFGIGGGSVIVPVLYEVFRIVGVHDDVRMQLCVGTSLAIIVPTTIRSYLAHREKGAVMPDVLRVWMAPMVIGVGIGAVIA